MKIVECVPNFSEGRNRQIIDSIADAIKTVPNVVLLDVDPGLATNRTVYTFAGNPDAVIEAAYQAIKRGVELIDMRTHKGEHARQGACDVCPFVPISGVTMKDCVEYAKRLAKRVSEDFNIPIYLYAEAATRPERKRLPDIRAGEYEALQEKLLKPEWVPDFGPAKFNPKAGATVIGARNFLIAYNVNLNTKSVKFAKDIAFAIREIGRVKRDERGEKIVGKDGVEERVEGIFKDVQATGWYISEYGRAQVTINILDIEKSPLHLVYDKCCELASGMGLRVTGSEIVGMVPKKVLIDAGIYFLKKQDASVGVSEDEIIKTAIFSLGLNDVSKFDPKKKIIEATFGGKMSLTSMTVQDFVAELASNSPAPGGGSVAALAGALSGALTTMVASLTFDKKGYEAVKTDMEKIGVEGHGLVASQIKAVEDDTFAFNRVMDCFSLPKNTEEEKAKRKAAIEEANKGATLEPLGTLKRSVSLLKIATIAAKDGNKNSLSDAGVAGLMARAGAYGAYYNVMINLGGIGDDAWKSNIRKEADSYLAEVKELADKLEAEMMQRLV